MQKIKCVAVGDGGVGKTCLFWTYAMKEFPQSIPTIQDHALCISRDNSIYNLGLFDAAGETEDKLRPLMYPGTDVALVCFSVVSPQSFESAKSKWIPEILQHCPDAPFILVGTKSDLRDDIATLEKLSSVNETPVTVEQGQDTAQTLGAADYVECSAQTLLGVEDTINHAVDAVLLNFSAKSKRTKCSIS
uniref:cdc42 homolog n=1 Tax=Styela clava TaxID=7725 RepID=UPI00193ABC05|nr:cdc42 homolog [Styela clava]